ncbi:NUDIX domain-containing protein [Streptomyces sp. AC627_RSS907]|uniref:NUDIX hydrolase n=1 Tax=Streptomyces sp. AC627_RSS907 TaxID=2823684 RepID=UPI0020B6F69A|nr:NUDIX domain-containing protein [Streptomyces sp. AC627_RSS907]
MTQVVEKAAWVHLDEGRLLTARTHGRDRFYLPGGTPEPGETHPPALAREIREELGVALALATVVRLLITEAPAGGKPAGTLVRTPCFTADHTSTPTPCGEIAYLAHGECHHPRSARTPRRERPAPALVNPDGAPAPHLPVPGLVHPFALTNLSRTRSSRR